MSNEMNEWHIDSVVPSSGVVFQSLNVCIVGSEIKYKQKACATEDEVNQAIYSYLYRVEQDIRKASKQISKGISKGMTS